MWSTSLPKEVKNSLLDFVQLYYKLWSKNYCFIAHKSGLSIVTGYTKTCSTHPTNILGLKTLLMCIG